MMNKKFITIIGVCALVLAGLAVFFLRSGFRAPDGSMPAAAALVGTSTQILVTDATSTAVLSNVPRKVPAGFKEYRNVHYTFSILYLDSLMVKEYSEGGGAGTITFQDPSQGTGFQIFVVPYHEAQVTAARFKQDEPSGVQTNLQSGLVAGATAAAFDGRDAVLGDTHEVWFIHGGFLYEVTTLKSLDGWLSNIISTWQFI